MFKLLISYFSERRSFVKIDGKVSSLRLLDHGVPQFLIMGLFINSLQYRV